MMRLKMMKLHKLIGIFVNFVFSQPSNLSNIYYPLANKMSLKTNYLTINYIILFIIINVFALIKFYIYLNYGI